MNCLGTGLELDPELFWDSNWHKTGTNSGSHSKIAQEIHSTLPTCQRLQRATLQVSHWYLWRICAQDDSPVRQLIPRSRVIHPNGCRKYDVTMTNKGGNAYGLSDYLQIFNINFLKNKGLSLDQYLHCTTYQRKSDLSRSPFVETFIREISTPSLRFLSKLRMWSDCTKASLLPRLAILMGLIFRLPQFTI